MLKKTLTCLLALVMLLSMCTAAFAAGETGSTGYDVRTRAGAGGNELVAEIYTAAGAGKNNGRFVIAYPEELTLLSAKSELEPGSEQISDVDMSKDGEISFAWATVAQQEEALLLSVTFKGPYDTSVDITITDPETGASDTVAIVFPPETIIIPMPGGDPEPAPGPGTDPEPVGPEEPYRFKDVMDESLWYFNAVYAVYDAGLMTGTGADMFSPNANLTRAALIQTIYRMAGSPKVTGANPYSDVTANAWYADAVIWGTQNGIVNGMDSSHFEPEGFVTREQTAAMMYRYWVFTGGARVTDTGMLDSFTDAANVSSWAKESMAWAVSNKVIKGVSASAPVINPLGTATRAEIAQILVNYMAIA